MAADPLFVAVDVGTGGARAVAFDGQAVQIAEVRCPYPTAVPGPGRAEQDAGAWTREATSALAGLATRIDPHRIAAIGLTGQTPTVVPVDAAARPLRAGMLYRDNRATDEAMEIISRFGAERLHERTGHVPSAFQVAPKILWLRRHEPAVFAKTRWFLQPRDLVAHTLTGRVVTDESHANATALFDLEARRWADDLIAELGIPRCTLPDALPPWTVIGGLTAAVSDRTGLLPDTPVVIGAGDSQCAALGAGVIEPGPVSEMAGSSSCVNSTVLHRIPDLRVTHYSHAVPGRFTTELGVNTTGAAIRWAVDAFGYGSFEALDAAAGEARRRIAAGDLGAPAAAAPFFSPRLGDGERDDPTARGSLVGLRDVHDHATIAFAVLEGVAAAVGQRVDVLRQGGCPVTELRAAGGGTRSSVLGQLKADALGVPVLHFDIDTSALGAAVVAARATGFGEEADAAMWAAHRRSRRFEPDDAAVLVAADRRRVRSESRSP